MGSFQNIVHNIITPPNTSNETPRDLEAQIWPIISNEVVRHLNSVFNSNEKSNIERHISNVEKQNPDINRESKTYKQKKEFFEWAVEAAAVAPSAETGASALWDAALEDILKRGDSRLVDVARNLYPSDVNILLEMIETPLDDSEVGERFKLMGLATNPIFVKKRFFRSSILQLYFTMGKFTLLGSFLLGAYWSNKIAKSIYQDLYKIYDANDSRFSSPEFETFSDITRLFAYSFVIFLTFSFIIPVREWISNYNRYRLTASGKEIAQKISKYSKNHSQKGRGSKDQI